MLATPAATGRDLADRRLGLRVAIVCALIQASDGFDLGTVGMTVPALAQVWHLPPAAFANAFVMSSVGILVGALLAGPAGDRWGRKRVLIASAAVIALFSLLSAAAPDLPTLVLLRFLTGIGLGGAMPTTVALTSDYAPRGRIPTYVMWMFAGNTAGGFIGGQVASVMLPGLGWQGVYLFGGALPLLTIPLLWTAIPARRPARTAAAVPQPRLGAILAGLFRGGLAARTCLLWGAFFINLLNMYLVIYWLPTVLTLAGLTPGDAAGAASWLNAGGVLCLLLYGPLADRIGPAPMLLATLPCAALFILAISRLDLPYVLEVAAIFGAGAALIGSQHLLNATATLAYPPSIRATGVGWALGVGRLGGIAGPALGGLLLREGIPPRQIFELICGTVLVAALVVLALTRVANRASSPGNTPATAGEEMGGALPLPDGGTTP